MRRPTFCSAFEDDDQTIPAASSPSDKESRLSKMKRMITGTILLGRKGKKETVQPLGTRTCLHGENGSEYYEKESLVDLMHTNMKMDEEIHKCKNTKGLKVKSSKEGFDENMDTENIPNKKEVSICLTKTNGNGNGKKLKEINIEISQDQPSATTEIVLKPRKRKERLDSEGSIKQENKVIRSNSEERPEDNGSKNKDLNIRRVSSHEDFSRVRVLQEMQPPTMPELSESAEGEDSKVKKNVFRMEEMFHNADELEHEKIRSCERFSRAGALPRGRRNLQKRRTKDSKKKRERMSEQFQMKADIPKEGPPRKEIGLEVAERDRSPSPGTSSPPALDISTLHKQMEGSEPITSRGKILSPEDEVDGPSLEVLISPRNSLVMRLMNSDPSVPPSPPKDHNIRLRTHDSQERKLTKQISSIKRQLKRYEEGFQEEFGYRPSQADKMANKDIKKLCSELNRLRAQLKQIREDAIDERSSSASRQKLSFLTSLEGGSNGSSGSWKHSKTSKTMEEVLKDVEKRLQEKRQQSGRSSEISEMNRGDLLEEKVAVQKALLYLENVFGRPVTREDRDLVRPLYQRYRSLKRLVIRSSGGKLNNSTGELATILEHEAMEFTTSPTASFDLGEGTFSVPEVLNMPTSCEFPMLMSEQQQQQQQQQLQDEAQNSSSSSDSLGENLHSLPLAQLLEQQKSAREEKKKLRRSLKEFEECFQSVAGRRAQKQDRIIIEGIYANYKQVKAKLRLLDALVAKKSCVKRNSC